MDLSDANVAKSLECPVCLDIYEQPKFLSCGHTICQGCVHKMIISRMRQLRDSVNCPECNAVTVITGDGLKTNYSLVDLISRAKKQNADSYACNGCAKRTPATELFTCETCQEALGSVPIWICALYAMKQHREHKTSDCNKATRKQVEDACDGITASRALSSMYAEFAESHVEEALQEVDHVSKLFGRGLNGFSRIEGRITSGDDHLTQEDLAASVQEAADLKLKFEQASALAKEASKEIGVALRKYQEGLANLLPCEEESGAPEEKRKAKPGRAEVSSQVNGNNDAGFLGLFANYPCSDLNTALRTRREPQVVADVNAPVGRMDRRLNRRWFGWQ